MGATKEWSTGAFDCCSDIGVCFYGWCFPSCLYGDNVAALTGGSCCGPCMLYTCCPMCACCFAGGTRTTLRSKYDLPEEPCSDCCMHWLCGACALCQEAREIKAQKEKKPESSSSSSSSSDDNDDDSKKAHKKRNKKHSNNH